MKVFVVLSCIALAVARPEAGYSYNQPGAGLGGSSSFSNGGSFGGSSLLSGGGSSFSGSSGISSEGLSSFGGSSAPSFSAGPALSSGASFGAAAPSFSAGPALSSGASFGAAAPSFSAGQSFSAGPSFSAAAPTLSAPSFAPQQFNAPQQALVQKHIYVHVPPQGEEELAQPLQSIAPAQPQKHYKIIFIKAPSTSVNRQQLVQLAQPQTEEKTIVYVLSKKQESVAELAQQIQPAPTTPSKPEVYFIKYKTQQEQQQFAPAAPISTGSISGGSISAAPISTGISSGSGSISSGFESAGPISTGPISAGPISNGISSGSGSISSGFESVAVSAPSSATSFSSGSAEASLPIAAAPHQPAPVYGPAH